MKNIKKQDNQKTINYQQLTIEIIKQKFLYILLGATIILVCFLIVIGYLKKSRITQIFKPINITKQQSNNSTVKNVSVKKIYIVTEGDSLWIIAENYFGSGYNAYDLAKINNIINPNIIEIGQKIIIPSIAPKTPTTGEITSLATGKVTFQGSKYTIQEGDCLWKIAQDTYGDGYLWTKIAKANNIENPNIIHVGNILIIPRE